MANTTDLMITTLFDDDAIDYINEKTGRDFKQLTDGENAGGAKVLSFESFGDCPRTLDDEEMKMLINTFKEATFSHPEYAVLLIDDDSYEQYNGVYLQASITPK